jgi:GPN-loop GTPase
MLHLTSAIDRATGYVYVQPSNSGPPGTVQPPPNSEASSRSRKPNEYALFTTAAGPLSGLRSHVDDVQERWIDAREDWDAFERREWRREGEAVRDAKARKDAQAKMAEEGSKPKIRTRGGPIT